MVDCEENEIRRKSIEKFSNSLDLFLSGVKK